MFTKLIFEAFMKDENFAVYIYFFLIFLFLKGNILFYFIFLPEKWVLN